MNSIDQFFNSPMIEKLQQQQKIFEKILMPSKVIADSMNRATIAAQQSSFIQSSAWNTVQEISKSIMSTPIAPNLAAYQEMSTTSYLAQLAPIIRQEQEYQNIIAALNTTLTTSSAIDLVDFDYIIDQEKLDFSPTQESYSIDDLTAIEEKVVLKLSTDTTLIDKFKKHFPQLSSKTTEEIAAYIFNEIIVKIFVGYILSELLK